MVNTIKMVGHTRWANKCEGCRVGPKGASTKGVSMDRPSPIVSSRFSDSNLLENLQGYTLIMDAAFVEFLLVLAEGGLPK